MSGADRGLDWVDTFVARDPRSPKTARNELILGLTSLLPGRIVRPSYQFLNDYHATGLYVLVRQRHYKEHGRSGHGLAMAWSLLRDVADLGEHARLHDAVRYGQRPTAELVDVYRLQCQPVRDVLVRYLEERRSSLDYSRSARSPRCARTHRRTAAPHGVTSPPSSPTSSISSAGVMPRHNAACSR